MSETILKTGNRKFVYAIGRRKSATAKIRLYGKGSGTFVVNGRPLQEYFPTAILQQAAIRALTATNNVDQYDANVEVMGGGPRGQSDAVKLAVARALVKADEGFKVVVKKEGLLTRDARVKERKKFGLKRARRAPQWAKR